MLKNEDRLTLEIHGNISTDLSSSLHVLYGPLIGKDALLLYDTLVALSHLPHPITNHVLVSKLSGLSCERIETVREILEQFLLLKTYYEGSKNAYIYCIHIPKNGNEFLRHDVFGRLFMKKMGKQVYEFTKKNFALSHKDKSGYQDITISMQTLMSDWNVEEETTFTTMKPQQLTQPAFAFNFDVFLSGLSLMILPESQRTKENLTFIAEKAGIYGISEKDMQMLVGKSMNIKTNRLDRNKLIKQMQSKKKAYHKTFDDPYAMPPVRFLQEKQFGVSVSTADQRLIDDVLIGKYHLVPEVINVLLEYVLQRCNQMLSKSYVEKVASTWVRLGIDTANKALESIKNEKQEPQRYQKSTKKELPEWFHNQDVVDVSKEDIDDDILMERLRKLGEE